MIHKIISNIPAAHIVHLALVYRYWLQHLPNERKYELLSKIQFARNLAHNLPQFDIALWYVKGLCIIVKRVVCAFSRIFCTTFDEKSDVIGCKAITFRSGS